MDTITDKDANNPPPKDGAPEIEEVLDKMSIIVLNEKHNFCNKIDIKIKTAMIDTLPNTDAINNKFLRKEAQSSTKWATMSGTTFALY